MELNHDALYEAFKARDARFDGRFFVGVSSTGIYCRPVCHARMPKQENCTFFANVAEAEKAGFRPCLTCRPELAPGHSAADAEQALATKAAHYLREHCTSGQSLQKAAARLGYTDRHLRRVFADYYHVTPVEYMQTCRLLLAKSLLTDSALPISRVAEAAGFGSTRRMNDLFKKHYHLCPSDFRKKARQNQPASEAITVALGYRPPYQWERIVGFLGMRAIPGVEQVQDGAYQRIVRLSGEKGPLLGWITVANDAANNRVRLTLAEDLLPALPALLGKVRRLFDLDCDPAAVAETLRSIDDVIPGANVYGLRIPGCVDTFEVCCRAILGQQISVKAAGVLAGRVAEAFGTPVEGAPEGLTCAFPTPEDILALDRPDRPLEEAFGQLGIIASRSRAILDVARLFANGTLNWDGPVDPQEEMAKLTAIKGIGPWTANYVAMRAMGYPDAFLETDGGVAHALPDLTPKQRVELAQQWRPWRSYAVMSLWESLS